MIGAARGVRVLCKPAKGLKYKPEIMEPYSLGTVSKPPGLPLLGFCLNGLEEKGWVVNHLLPSGSIGFAVVAQPCDQLSCGCALPGDPACKANGMRAVGARQGRKDAGGGPTGEAA